jgi:hypothetical protein
MGLHVGYRYADSPIVVPDGTMEPPDDPRIPVQSTWPGCRAPHAWVAPGRTTLDSYDSSKFVLVSRKPNGAEAAFTKAAAELNIPLATVHFATEEAQALYQSDYVLVRPDGHVSWRGNEIHADPKKILSLVTGH